MEGLVGIFMGAAQYDFNSRPNVQDVCNFMENDWNGSPLERLMALNS